MNWHLLRLLYLHEMRQLMRARRTLILSVVMPALLMPAMLFASRFANQQRQKTLDSTTYKYSITGPLAGRVRSWIERTPNSPADSSDASKFKEVQSADAARALEHGDVHFFIETIEAASADKLPEKPRERPAGIPLIRVVYRGNQDSSSSGHGRIVQLLERATGRAIREKQMTLLGTASLTLEAGRWIVSGESNGFYCDQIDIFNR